MAPDGPTTFGSLLKRYRRALHLTQDHLAERAGYHPNYVGMLERGVRTASPATIDSLAGALSLSPADRMALHEAASSIRNAPYGYSAASRFPPGNDASRIVGRTVELALIREHLASEKATYRPPFLILAGEPGIGKSTLLQEAGSLAHGLGLTVVGGGCRRRGNAEPYAPFPDALRAYVSQVPAEHVQRSLDGCSWLLRLLPDLAPMLLPSLLPMNLPPEQERRFLFAAVARFLANVAAPAGTLLVLDDLQWASPDAVDLLLSLLSEPLAGMPASAPLRILAAYRDTEVGANDPLWALLADLSQAGLIQRIPLRPLPAADAELLLKGLLSPSGEEAGGLIDRIVKRAGGVPFFLVTCAHSLDGQRRSSGHGEEIPWSLAQGIRGRIAMLPVESREVLEVAAVTGRQVQHAVLLAAVDRPEDRVVEGVDAACQARLLWHESSHVYAFVHDIIREVIEEDLGPGRRTLLHRRVGDALENRGGASCADLAYHFLQGADPVRALHYTLSAGDAAAAMFAHGEAGRQYRSAVDLARRLSDTVREAEGLEKLGDVLRRPGRNDEALARLQEAAALYRTRGDPEGEGRVEALIGLVHFARGTSREGILRLESALPSLEPRVSSLTLAALYEADAQLRFSTNPFHQQLVTAARFLRAARSAGEPGTIARALGRYGTSLTYFGWTDEGTVFLEEALALAEAADDHYAVLCALNDLTEIYEMLGATGKVLPNRRRYISLAEQIGWQGEVAFGLCGLAQTLMLRGDWPEAHTHLVRAEALTRTPLSWYSSTPLLSLGELCFLQGDHGSARNYLLEGIRIAESQQNLVHVDVGRFLLAELDLEEGQPEAAIAGIEQHLERVGPDDWVAGLALPVLAEAQLHCADGPAGLERAVESADRAVEQATARRHRLRLAPALRAQAMVLARMGRFDKARDSFAEAVSLAREVSYPYAEARSLQAWSDMHIVIGDNARARELLEEALAIFRRLGARHWIDGTRAALAALPAGVP